jgi:hypothetical protein
LIKSEKLPKYELKKGMRQERLNRGKSYDYPNDTTKVAPFLARFSQISRKTEAVVVSCTRLIP